MTLPATGGVAVFDFAPRYLNRQPGGQSFVSFTVTSTDGIYGGNLMFLPVPGWAKRARLSAFPSETTDPVLVSTSEFSLRSVSRDSGQRIAADAVAVTQYVERTISVDGAENLYVAVPGEHLSLSIVWEG